MWNLCLKQFYIVPVTSAAGPSYGWKTQSLSTIPFFRWLLRLQKQIVASQIHAVLLVYHSKCQLSKLRHTCSSQNQNLNMTVFIYMQLIPVSVTKLPCYWSRRSNILEGKLTKIGQVVKNSRMWSATNRYRNSCLFWKKKKKAVFSAVLHFHLWEKKRKFIFLHKKQTNTFFNFTLHFTNSSQSSLSWAEWWKKCYPEWVDTTVYFVRKWRFVYGFPG